MSMPFFKIKIDLLIYLITYYIEAWAVCTQVKYKIDWHMQNSNLFVFLNFHHPTNIYLHSSKRSILLNRFSDIFSIYVHLIMVISTYFFFVFHFLSQLLRSGKVTEKKNFIGNAFIALPFPRPNLIHSLSIHYYRSGPNNYSLLATWYFLHQDQ